MAFIKPEDNTKLLTDIRNMMQEIVRILKLNARYKE
jgi:hypothetical protein